MHGSFIQGYDHVTRSRDNRTVVGGNGHPTQTQCCKKRFYFSYKIDILRDNGLKFGVQYSVIYNINPTKLYIIMKLFKNIQNLPFFEQIKNVFLQHLRVWVGCPSNPTVVEEDEVSKAR